MPRYEILAPTNGVMQVVLTNLRRSDAEELLASYGKNARRRAIPAAA